MTAARPVPRNGFLMSVRGAYTDLEGAYYEREDEGVCDALHHTLKQGMRDVLPASHVDPGSVPLSRKSAKFLCKTHPQAYWRPIPLPLRQGTARSGFVVGRFRIAIEL